MVPLKLDFIQSFHLKYKDHIILTNPNFVHSEPIHVFCHSLDIFLVIFPLLSRLHKQGLENYVNLVVVERMLLVVEIQAFFNNLNFDTCFMWFTITPMVREHVDSHRPQFSFFGVSSGFFDIWCFLPM